uniref:Uncharacterized protein n=1 Tax=Amphiprion percula TaxID=161767 RepID=A0A3P8S3S1_AMPPE
MFNKVTKMSTVTLKAKLKAKKESLNLVSISVPESVCRTLNSQWCRKPHRKLLLMTTVYLMFAKNYLNTPQSYWKKIFLDYWT